MGNFDTKTCTLGENHMLTKEKYFDTLKKGLKDILDEMPDQMIQGQESFNSYGVDSLDLMNLILFLEDELDIDLEEIDNNESLNPDKLYDFIVNNA